MQILRVIAITVLFAIGLSADGMVADKRERDLVCGLQPYKNPRWMSEIELINEKKIHFVSVKCMMLFYYKNSKWDDLEIQAGTKEPIKALRVQDYLSLKIVDAKEAFYVYGSRIVGPKGDDVIPFETREDAQHFIDKNGGTKILTWKDFKLNLFDLLNL
ncbi:MAG: nitrous oxide reductase accessory protein NosL [Epsilonproteobacteria bacterium]|nr:nitrous oxide reductase accessory protein NosL [Campylobacterota bacterium]